MLDAARIGGLAGRDVLDRVLANVYGQEAEAISKTITRYQEYYDLPVIVRTEEVHPRLFRHYQRGGHFATLAICNEADEVLVVSDGDGGAENGWKLIGGYIARSERIEDAYTRLVTTETGLHIDEIQPLAVVVNEFVCEKRRIIHRGLAFLVSARGDLHLLPGRSGEFIGEIPGPMAYANREVLELALSTLREQVVFTPYDEIDISRSRTVQQIIHSRVINPPFKYLSSRPLKKRIAGYCAGGETILDAACGDDTLIFDLARTAAFCVANDISFHTLGHLRAQNPPGNVLFTNHNATDLPFKRKFDVVIFKNTLHHMHDLEELVAALESLRRVARRLVIVDIEDPLKSTRWARLWHQYYVHFLGDRGGYFLSRERFTEVISCMYADAEIQFDLVSTLKGNYMLAIVDFEQKANGQRQ